MAPRSRKRPATKVQTHNVAAGTTIRFEEPKSKRTAKSPVVVVAQDINPVEGFLGFLRDHAIVGLSIGFIVGSQMTAFVNVFVQNFINPLTQLFFGTALSERKLTLHFHDNESQFGWGAIAYSLLSIILLLISVYVAIKLFSLEKLDKPKKKSSKQELEIKETA
jgi:large-conductance mechanosensitive channel